MLKHCQATAADLTRRSRRSLNGNDNSSLNSSNSSSFNSSFGSDNASNGGNAPHDRRASFSSPEPISLASRASSFASLSLEAHGPKTPIKIYAKCLRPDIEYKTLSVGSQSTCKEIIWLLLSKYKMKHRDPNLFYLTMDISITRTGVPLKRTLVLEDEARPAELKSCHPWGECRFTLQTRKGGLVRVHDSILMAESKYKALLIAEHTTVEDVVRILLNCYGLERIERVERFTIYEQCQSQCYERRLHSKDRPAQVQSLWPNPSQFHFVLRRSELPASNSAGVSPVSSDIETMDVSYASSSSSSSSSSTYFSALPPSPSSAAAAKERFQPPNFRLNAPVTAAATTSIHQSGLPPPPALRPKPTGAQSLLLLNPNNNHNNNNNSQKTRGSFALASFHDYENYFYI